MCNFNYKEPIDRKSDFTISLNQLKNGHLACFCQVGNGYISVIFVTVMLLKLKTRRKIEIVEFPDSTGDRWRENFFTLA